MKKSRNDLRRHYSPDEKIALLQRWSESGLSTEEFAKLAGVGGSTLYLWQQKQRQQKQRQQNQQAAQMAIAPAAFVPVRLRKPVRGATGVKIQGAHGFIVVVERGCDMDVLRMALEAIARCG
jgi:transposase-like protein